MADLQRGIDRIVPRAALAVVARVPPSSVQKRGLRHLALVAAVVALVVAWQGARLSLQAGSRGGTGAVLVLGLVSLGVLAPLWLRSVPLGVKLGLGSAYWVFLGAVLPYVAVTFGWTWVNLGRLVEVLLLTFPLVLPLSPIAAGILIAVLSAGDVWWIWLASWLGATSAPLSSHTLAASGSVNPWLGAELSAGLAVLVYAAHYTAWRAQSAWETWGSLLPRRQLASGEGGSTWELYPGRLKQRAVVQLSPPTAQFDDEAYERFEMEMRRLTTLRSPHIATVYEFGVSQTGATYCVREHAHGLSFNHLVQQHDALMPERVITLLIQVCSALVEALEVGMFHGALTADNVLLTRNRQEYDVVKVLNFGLWSWLPVKQAPGDGQSFKYRGEPGYLSPELITTSERGAATDVYALGCLGFLLLTGRCPFVGEPSTVLGEHLHAEVPTVTALASMRPPKDLEQIVLDCLHKDPEKRPDVLTVRRRLRACGAASHWHQGRAKAWWTANVPEPEPEPVSKRGRVSRRALFRGRLK